VNRRPIQNYKLSAPNEPSKYRKRSSGPFSDQVADGATLSIAVKLS
jgi:hypothetical protein